eukprot:GHVS01067332.1.p3 GENE.GHVS01067332.1~~GHVS01067332.1.p3  ORF type:complete len:116 (+),score=19.88 GHVS01067332.1:397-744(+)
MYVNVHLCKPVHSTYVHVQDHLPSPSPYNLNISIVPALSASNVEALLHGPLTTSHYPLRLPLPLPPRLVVSTVAATTSPALLPLPLAAAARLLVPLPPPLPLPIISSMSGSCGVI